MLTCYCATIAMRTWSMIHSVLGLGAVPGVNCFQSSTSHSLLSAQRSPQHTTPTAESKPVDCKDR